MKVIWVSGKHFPGLDFPLWKLEMLTYFIYFAQLESQHFPLMNFIKKGKVNLHFDLTLLHNLSLKFLLVKWSVFLIVHYLGRQIFGPKIFFGHKIFLEPGNFFGGKTFMDPIFFWGQTFFRTSIFWGPRFALDPKFFRPKIFGSYHSSSKSYSFGFGSWH